MRKITFVPGLTRRKRVRKLIAPTSSSAVTDCVCNVSYYGSDGGRVLHVRRTSTVPAGKTKSPVCRSFFGYFIFED